MQVKDKLFIASQYVAPHRMVSRLAGALAQCRIPAVKNYLIASFIARYQVDMSQAEVQEIGRFEHFNAFFTRALRAGARPIAHEADSVACPADGAISQLGAIDGDRIFQAKGHHYTTRDLLGGDAALAAAFEGGAFATIYLSPRDYHRVHMPVRGKLLRTIYVPGRLFSVNTVTARSVPRLFARNERLVCLFDTDRGRVAVVLVGAMIVGSMETVWSGLVDPHRSGIVTTRYDDGGHPPVVLEQGNEMGRFKLGSTVVLLFERGQVNWREELSSLSTVFMGQNLARAS